MKTLSIAFMLLAAAAPAAMAQKAPAAAAVDAPRQYQPLTYAQLAEETGMPANDVRAVMCAHVARPENQTTYLRNERRFRQALGEDRYQDLLAGRPIKLRVPASRDMARLDGMSGPGAIRP